MTGHSGFIAAALLAGAVATTGCSDGKTAASPKTPERAPVAPTPTGTSFVPESPVVAAAPKPVTFADGEVAYYAGKYGDASAVFAQIKSERPGSVHAHYMHGLSAAKSGDAKSALESFDEVLRLAPDHVKSLVNSARVLIDQKRVEDALPRLDHAAMLNPDSADVQRLFGRAYHNQGKRDEAMMAYERAIELDPKDAWSMNNLGLLLFEQGRFEEAASTLTQAVELRNNVAVFHNNLGMALEHLGRFQAAAGSYRAALEVEPENEKAKRNFARVETLKDLPGAHEGC